MSRSIPLHKDRGIDPHLTFCLRCGGDANELTLGELRKAELPNGQWVYANRGETTKLAKDLEEQGVINHGYRYNLPWKEVPEHEKVPASEPCDDCQKELKEHKAIVADGGVYVTCKECGMTGVLRPGVPLAVRVREHSGIAAPDPVGYEHDGCGAEDAIIFPGCPNGHDK